MRNAVLAIGAGLIAILCLGGAAAAFVLLSQVRGSPLPFLRSLTLQRQAQSQACQPPASLVPASYQADPVQAVGDWVVVTYTGECDPPGQPRQIVSGFVAISSRGPSCAGWGSHALDTLLPNGPATFDNISRGQCGGPSGPGEPSGLDVVTGLISGTRAVTIEASFAGGGTVSGPITKGRFAVTAPADRTICVVRALDASGVVVVADKLVEGGSAVPQGACP